MKYLTIACLLIIYGFQINCIAGQTIDAAQIVAKADEVRNPGLEYTTNVTLESFTPGSKKKEVSTYEVLIKGKTKTLIKTLSPAVDRGQTLLMRDRDLWAFLPDVEKPLRISLQQRLVGQVSNGDLARANFSGDYTAKLLTRETVGQTSCMVLELTAKDDFVTYGKIKYWVNADNYNPVKAEFYAISGRLLKNCSYEKYKTLAGRLRPSLLVLSNPLVKGEYSTIEYTDMKVSDLPEKYFSKDYLKKLKY